MKTAPDAHYFYNGCRIVVTQSQYTGEFGVLVHLPDTDHFSTGFRCAADALSYAKRVINQRLAEPQGT